MAEALAGIALAQLIRPGAPVVFGASCRNTDMQSGSPSFGTPESGDRRALHRPDRQALRPAVARRRRAERFADGRRPGRVRIADDAPADVPRRRQLRDALGRLARGRARVVLREVHRRHRAAARAAPRVHAARDRRGVARVRRPRRGRRRRPLPRRRAHARALPRVLLPAAALEHRELRPLDQEGRPRHDRPRRRDLARDARELRAAAAR